VRLTHYQINLTYIKPMSYVDVFQVPFPTVEKQPDADPRPTKKAKHEVDPAISSSYRELQASAKPAVATDGLATYAKPTHSATVASPTINTAENQHITEPTADTMELDSQPSTALTFFKHKNKDGVGPQDQMKAHSDEHGHKIHITEQYTYDSNGTIRCAYAYASLPTLNDLVAYVRDYPEDQDQCLNEMAREKCIVAPYMDVDLVLSGDPQPHLLDAVVECLISFTERHLNKRPRIVCTDSSRPIDKTTDGVHYTYKHSWHIILHDIGGFPNGANQFHKGGDMELFFRAFVDFKSDFKSLPISSRLKALPGNTWDMSVYAKNSLMRCIHSHKADDLSKTRLKSHANYSGNSLADYFIQQPDLQLIELPSYLRPPKLTKPLTQSVVLKSPLRLKFANF
jgi:hypothetical protein